MVRPSDCGADDDQCHANDDGGHTRTYGHILDNSAYNARDDESHADLAGFVTQHGKVETKSHVRLVYAPEPVRRMEITSVANSWLDTQFRHQLRVEHVGAAPTPTCRRAMYPSPSTTRSQLREAAPMLTNSALDPFGKILEFKFCAVQVSAADVRIDAKRSEREVSAA